MEEKTKGKNILKAVTGYTRAPGKSGKNRERKKLDSQDMWDSQIYALVGPATQP